MATNKNEIISAGSSKTFELKATTSNVVTDDYTSVKIVEDSGAVAAATKAAAAGSLIWSDNSASPHDDTTSDYFNSFQVNGLDTNTTTLTN